MQRVKVSAKKEVPLVDSAFSPEEERAVQAGDGDRDEFNREQQSADHGVWCGRR